MLPKRPASRCRLHPKDPPVKAMRGVSRLLTSTEEIEAFLDAVPSPANGFTFCQGTVTEMGVDVIDAIRRIGGRGRIHHVHFRAVRGSVPRYEETFIDEGDVDMLDAMRAYKDVGLRSGDRLGPQSGYSRGPAGPQDWPLVLAWVHPGTGAGGERMTARRRELLRDGAALAMAAALARSASAQGPPDQDRQGIARPVGRERLEFFQMLGIRHVVMPTSYSLAQRRRGLVPATDTGPRNRCADEAVGPRGAQNGSSSRIENKGLVPMMLHLGRVHRVVQGRPDASAEIEAVKTNIRIAGELGIPVIEYNLHRPEGLGGLRADDRAGRDRAPGL